LCVFRAPLQLRRHSSFRAIIVANIQFRHASIRLIHFNGQNVIVLDTVNRL
jgi:hypothetical protein